MSAAPRYILQMTGQHSQGTKLLFIDDEGNTHELPGLTAIAVKIAIDDVYRLDVSLNSPILVEHKA